MFIITYGFGDSVTTVPVYGFLSGSVLPPAPAVVDIEFDMNITRSISFTMNIKKTITFIGDLS